MKSFLKKILVVALSAFTAAAFMSGASVYADGSNGTSISISPVNKIMQISANSTYDDTFKVSNNSDSPMKFEVYATPYAFSYSEDEDTYKLGFSKDTTYTQIARWITFQGTDGNYAQKATFTAGPNESIEVAYRITTPDNIPGGGQYAVLFAHTLSGDSDGSGIKTEASPGLVVYGRSDGETIISGEASNLEIKQTMMVNGEEKSIINASSKVKNTGNVDFMANGNLKVTGVFGNTYYETSSDSTKSRVSIIPETELVVSDSWDDTPFFGMFNTEWTVYVNGEATETITKFVVIIPAVIIIVAILLLTIVIVWIIIMVRMRKERRSRFMV
ncbi:hypothetical protein IJ076_00985 [Candidatus Saccharibacteria bacterium]|nr:hypothetical protein [Candidatus Saccharibacteria bacterium]